MYENFFYVLLVLGSLTWCVVDFNSWTEFRDVYSEETLIYFGAFILLVFIGFIVAIAVDSYYQEIKNKFKKTRK
jgi:NADH:ubiquinone oxidoreductase subunit 4 (subunit M)